MHPVRAAAHGTEKLHAHLARRHAAGHRRHRLRPPDLALGRRRNAARPVARLDDARRRRSAGQQPQSHQGQEKYGRRTDRLAVLQEEQRPRPLQRTRAYDARRLRAGSPPLRRRAGLPFHDPEKGRHPGRERAGRLYLPGRLYGVRPLCRTQAAARFRRAVPQFVREHLHPSPADAARPPQTDLPARAGGTSRRPQDGHHRGRPAGLSGPLPQQLDGGPRTEGRVRPLSQKRGTGRPQPVADAGHGARTLHRRDRRHPVVPVARNGRIEGRQPTARQRPGLPPRPGLEDRRHFVDQTRQSGLGVVERLEPLRRRFQGGHQQRNL